MVFLLSFINISTLVWLNFIYLFSNQPEIIR
jgi:hypothetical protein